MASVAPSMFSQALPPSRLTCHCSAGAGVPTDESNLIYRAMTEVFAAVGRFPKSVTIEQTDRIPMASGLGSSAACVAASAAAGAVVVSDMRFPFSVRSWKIWAVNRHIPEERGVQAGRGKHVGEGRRNLS